MPITLNIEDKYVDMHIQLYEKIRQDIQTRISELEQERKELLDRNKGIEVTLRQLKTLPKNAESKKIESTGFTRVISNRSRSNDIWFEKTRQELDNSKEPLSTSYIVDNLRRNLEDSSLDRRYVVKKVSYVLSALVKNGVVLRDKDEDGEYVYSLKM